MILLLLILLGAPPAKLSPPKLTEKQTIELYHTVLDQIKSRSDRPPNTPELILYSINALLKKHDPYGELMKPNVYQSFQKRFSGQKSGVGIEVELNKNEVIIASILPNSPAEKGKIPVGATLEKIGKEGIDQFEGDIDLIRKKLRRPAGKKVTLSYFYKNSFKTVTLTSINLIRFGFQYHQLTKNQIALLQIDLFQEKMVDKIERYLKKKQFKQLIIDLRNNPGGYIDEAIKLADLFLKKGVIVSYKERNQKEVFYSATPKTPFANKPLIILINQESASAAEIFSAAMKDHGRAVLIGQKSYGKGSIQTLYALKHQFALKITTARYRTPTGEKIDEKGISPHIILPRFFEFSTQNSLEKISYILKNDHQLYTAFKLFESHLPIFGHHPNTK